LSPGNPPSLNHSLHRQKRSAHLNVIDLPHR
jgi:hypothetical protein